MRWIKFRAKTYEDRFYPDLAPSKWVYGFITQFPQACTWMHISSDDRVMVSPDTVGQFTGFHDKDGKEIYEWDIVRNKEIGGYGLEYIGVVRYYEEDCRFGIDTTTTNKFTKRLLFTNDECSFNDGYCTIKYCNEYEVLGNIFDNPELLKSL
jgi:uncharacterized phage protein (TIGR01671 family)